MFGISHWELLIIFLVVLLLFGAKRIPEMARGLGKGIREFRGAVKEVQDEVDVAGRREASNRIDAPAPGETPPTDDQGASPAREEARS